MKVVSGKYLARVAESHGWELRGVKGSHHGYVKPGHRPVTIPVHRNEDLGVGLLKKLLKQLGLTEADL